MIIVIKMIKEMIIAIMELQYYFPTLSVILLRALIVSILRFAFLVIFGITRLY